MATTITMPVLSPTMEEGVIARWLKKEGDHVSSGDPLCEITTDKSTVEFTSIEDGYLRRIVIGDGERGVVNQGIGVITDSADEDISSYELEEPNLKKVAVAASAEEEPQAGSGIQDGQASSSSRPVASGIVFEPSPPRENYKFPEKDALASVIASPLAKRVAKEQGLDLSSVKGSGPGGRVIAKDLETAQKQGLISYGDGTPAQAPGTFEQESLSPVRKVIGERLQASKMTIPHYYITEEIRVDALMDMRVQLKEMGMKVTYNDFILRATALALRKHPEVNSGYNSKENQIIRFKTVDISLAVSIPDGLITPILYHADYKDLLQLSQEARLLAKKAKENRLAPEEYQGGSFTVSNLGMFGIHSFSGVINPPQAGILSVGGIKEKAIVNEGLVKCGHVLYVTISLDHRVIDGAQGAGFLITLKRYLEHPASLIV